MLGADRRPELRFADSDDLPGIAGFLPELGGPHFAARFPGGTSEDFYRWKYLMNPLGGAIVGIAVSGARIVSVVAATPKQVQYRGQTVLAYELGDFLTAADHRGRGLFSELVELVCREAADRGADFAYVRPNETSFPILVRRSGFQEVRRISARRFTFPVDAISRKTNVPAALLRLSGMDWLVRRAFVPTLRDSSLVVQRISCFGSGSDELWRHAAAGYDFALRRDAAYLNWRFCDCPTPYWVWIASRGATIAGHVVAFSEPSSGTAYVVDLFTEADDAEAASALLANCFDALLAAGIRSVNTWVLEGAERFCGHRTLRRAFLFRAKQHLHLAMKQLQGGDIASGQDRWLFTMGDCDGV